MRSAGGPPVQAPVSPPVVQAPVARPAPVERPAETPAAPATEAPATPSAAADAAPATTPPGRIAPIRSAPAAGDYRVRNGDTLAGIAQRNMPAGVTLQQMLVALYRANEDAFVGIDEIVYCFAEWECSNTHGIEVDSLVSEEL